MRVELPVPDLGREPVRPAEDPTVEDDAPTDAGPEREEQRVAHALHRAVGELAATNTGSPFEMLGAFLRGEPLTWGGDAVVFEADPLADISVLTRTDQIARRAGMRSFQKLLDEDPVYRHYDWLYLTDG